MGNWKPLFYSLMTIFFLAIVVELVITPFIEEITPNPNSFLSGDVFDVFLETFSTDPLIDIPLFDINFTIFSNEVYIPICIPLLNPLALMPFSWAEFMMTRIVLMTYIPDIILIPVLILTSLGVIWGVVKLILA